jgi:hypothetical protein
MNKHRVSWVALVWECLGNPFLFVTYISPPSRKYAHIHYEKPWNHNTGFQINYTSFLPFIFENANTA